MSNAPTNGKAKHKRHGKPGNKSLLTPKFIKQVEQLAAQGLTQRQIATILNINSCTISGWKSKGTALSDKFVKALERGEARGVQRRLKVIDKAMNKSWQAAAWMLERRNPNEFARKDNLAVSDPDGKPLAGGTTVIAPTVVFIQPKKEDLTEQVIELTGNQSAKQLPNGLPSGNGKH